VLAAGLDKPLGPGSIRAGWRMDDGVHAVTFGLGYTDAGGSIEYGLSVPLVADLGFGSIVQQVSVRFSAMPPIDEP
jgi:hypothetical protein